MGDIGFLNFGRGSNLAQALCCSKRRCSPHQNLLDDNSKKLSQSNQSFHVLNLRILGTSRVLDIKKREKIKSTNPLALLRLTDTSNFVPYVLNMDGAELECKLKDD